MEKGESYEMVWQTIYRYINCSIVHPYTVLMFYSFNSAGNMIHFEHFTLAHYLSLFNNDRLLSVILIRLQWHY